MPSTPSPDLIARLAKLPESAIDADVLRARLEERHHKRQVAAEAHAAAVATRAAMESEKAAAAAVNRMKHAAVAQQRARNRIIAAVAMKELLLQQRRVAQERHAQLAAAALARREALREMTILVNEAEAASTLTTMRPPPVVVPNETSPERGRIFYTPKHAMMTPEPCSSKSEDVTSPFRPGLFSPGLPMRRGPVLVKTPKATEQAERAMRRRIQIVIPIVMDELVRDCVYEPYEC